MSYFEHIVTEVDPDWMTLQREYACRYEETRNRLRASWIPGTIDDDELWMDLFVMAEQVEQDIALL